MKYFLFEGPEALVLTYSDIYLWIKTHFTAESFQTRWHIMSLSLGITVIIFYVFLFVNKPCPQTQTRTKCLLCLQQEPMSLTEQMDELLVRVQTWDFMTKRKIHTNSVFKLWNKNIEQQHAQCDSSTHVSCLSSSGDGSSALSLLQSNFQVFQVCWCITSLLPQSRSLGNQESQSYNSCCRPAGGETDRQGQTGERLQRHGLCCWVKHLDRHKNSCSLLNTTNCCWSEFQTPAAASVVNKPHTWRSVQHSAPTVPAASLMTN